MASALDQSLDLDNITRLLECGQPLGVERLLGTIVRQLDAVRIELAGVDNLENHPNSLANLVVGIECGQNLGTELLLATIVRELDSIRIANATP